MYYIEFFDRRPGVPLRQFQELVTTSFPEWSRRQPQDELVLAVGRTWRLGPYPYVLAWGCRGFDRLPEWDATFRSSSVDDLEEPLLEAIDTFASGFYRDIGPARPRPAGGPFYLETFTPWDGAAEDYERRTQAAGLTLNLLLGRIGLLGPDPGGIALVSLGSLADIEALSVDVPTAVQAVGCYAPIGDEVL